MTSLLERSLSYATIGELDRLSKSLEEIGREYYQRYGFKTLRYVEPAQTAQPTTCKMERP